MVAHESAHVAAHDNLTRLLFAAAPVVPFTTAACCAIVDAWIGASEEAADDEARREGRSPLVLASALTKVARLATGRAPLAHASAILSGNGVEQRVRRLLEPPPREHGGRVRAPYIAAGAFALATVASPRVAHAIYDVAEYCVRHLP